jgi:hypothetical protein
MEYILSFTVEAVRPISQAADTISTRDSSLFQVDQVVHHIGGNGEVDGPVHEVEAEEGDGEDNPAVLVNVACLHAKETLRRSWRRTRDSSCRWRRHGS